MPTDRFFLGSSNSSTISLFGSFLLLMTRAVFGVTCINPRAPAGETAKASYLLSWRTIAQTRHGFTPPLAAFSEVSLRCTRG